MKILILEDNQDCVLLFREILGKGNELIFFPDLSHLSQGLKETDLRDCELLLADLKLPDGYFLDFISKQNSRLMEEVPTVIISSLEDADILRTSFEWGAVDFLIKPFRKGELIAKVEKARRHFALDYSQHADILDSLTLIESKIFQAFLQRPNQHLTRESIQNCVWKKVAVNSGTFSVHLSNLRKKLLHSEWSIEFEEQKGWALKKI